MNPTRQPIFPTLRGQRKETPLSETYVQQTASAQNRYVTVLPPKPAANPVEQDAGATPEQAAVYHYNAHGNDTPLPRRLSQHEPPTPSRYVQMLLGLDKIPRLHNIYASIFTWLILAGYIVFPGTFTSLRKSNAIKNAANSNKAEKAILDTIQNAPLLWVAGGCCAFGASGIFWLWWRWNANFIWLVNRIFLPCLLNAIVGLVSTLINVYAAQDGDWSVTARITAVMTGTCAGTSFVLFLVYNNWLLYKVKKDPKMKSSNEHSPQSSAQIGE